MTRQLIAALLLLLPAILLAQAPAKNADPAKRQYHTQKVQSGEIEFDGKLDEPVWQRVEAGADFIEYQPDEGTSPEQKTEFRIVYDDKYLYIGYRVYDSAPDSIVERMSRRDEFPGDWVEINIDSYHDLRTAFSFTFSCSGVRGDEFISDNGNNWDTNWNPIWDGKSQIDDKGWTAEVKIPFSQLRYNGDPEQVWGFQVQRLIFRKNERSTFQRIPQNGSGWVSRFAELHGLRDLPHNKGVEVAPYVLAKTEHFEKEPGNPFADGSRQNGTVGVDGKFAVTRDLILDYSINPDFGQVEADPGAVRLDGYQVFFNERRPFFMESRNLFDYSLTGSDAGFDYDSDILFYSRRIGGAPHGQASLKSGEFADVPQATSILGATKFSGKTKGWSIGILESVTRREYATIDNNGERREELVEPRTNYFVGRVMKDFDEGNTILGAVFTSVNREKGLDWLHRNAYSGGLDFQHFWKNRWWNVKGNILFSRVEGTPEAIQATQQSFEHLFQRPNAPHVAVDPNRTSLTGTSGTFKLAKYGGNPDGWGGIKKFQVGVTWRSPEFEVNDIGFMQTADEINHWTFAGYHIQKPFSVFRNLRVNYNHWFKWDFGGQYLFSMYNANAHAFFKNNWETGMGISVNPYDVSNNALRGGSSLRRPAGSWMFVYMNSDSRKKINYFMNADYGRGFEHVVNSGSVTVGASSQVTDALQFSLYPGYGKSWRKYDQYVETANFGDETRTVVSEVNQENFSLTARLTYNLTPDLTLQYYGQPFIFRALYKNYGIVTQPLADKSADRFHVFTEQEIATNADGGFDVDENADGVVDYGFYKPDFNFIQFRSNLVMRWEYVPGSEFYLVWSQGIVPNAYNDLDTPVVRSLFDNMFDSKPTNIFLVKATYRLVR
ncbi:MAG: carbohydrate binding family 9 domain-containing protein [Saprospiraceae bacterium]|nr:carbohydrate binding family 9 domain-containing protein [Saprospiraceae bacterium]